MAAAAAAGRPADPWRRLMSAVYESVSLFGVVFFFGYGFSALTRFQGADGALRNGFQLFLFLVLGAYFVWFWAHDRWTLPMKTMGVRLVDARYGRPLGYGRAAWRYLVASALLWGLIAAVWKASAWWLLALPLPFAWALFEPRRRTLYDLLAGTVLIHVPLAPPRPLAAGDAGPIGPG
ncbi:MAG: RDD family protein, partial [Lautropia sp.]